MITITVRCRSFTVPNFVVLEGVGDGPTPIHVEEVDAAVLAKLCKEFRAGVFAKAKKGDPDWRRQ